MKRRALFGILVSLCLMAITRWNVADAITSLKKVAVTASVTMTSGVGNLTIIVQPLPAQAFFGKNVVIPITISNNNAQSLETTNLRIEMLYQMVDPNGSPLNPVTSLPILFEKNPLKPNTLAGTAILPIDNIQGIQTAGSQLKYYFHAQQGAGSLFFSAGGPSSTGTGAGAANAPSDAFDTKIITSLTEPISPNGATVSLPDLSEPDQPTSIQFAPGALSGPGTLFVERENESHYPGLLGVKPVVVYTLTLQGTSLVRTAQITLGYPADPNGNITGTNSPGTNLGMYYMDTYGWRILGRPLVDTTLHTVTTITPHFSTFALIPAGTIGASDLRPAERIITPNGDGINDEAHFSGVDGDIRIFDVRGRRVKTISSANPVWDGTDDSGRIVESGVYLYQYTSQGERVSGVIGVAK